jgi:cytidyltransferase-like protein
MIRRTEKRIVELAHLKGIHRQSKETGMRLIYTEGFFDPLHHEHVEYLERAARAAKDAWLVVGVVRDDMKRQLKGKDPFLEEHGRIRCVAALACVDYAVLIRSPSEIIPLLRPDVIVIAPCSIPERNEEKRTLAQKYCARIAEIESEETVHSSEIVRRMTAENA